MIYTRPLGRDRIICMISKNIFRGLMFTASYLTFLIFCSQASAQTLFSRDLTVGMSGSDVKALQVMLNQDPSTEVAAAGPGSPGQETAYFGPLTAAAVSRFQERYASEILAPAGLSGGTGYVGVRTRAKLEMLTNAGDLPPKGSSGGSPAGSSTTPTVIPASTPTSPPSTPTAIQITPSAASSSEAAEEASLARGIIRQQDAFQAVSPDDLLIFGISHDKIKPGDALTVTGFGFDPGTVVHIGRSYSAVVIATSSDSFTIQAPTLPYGVYDLWVTNGRGSSMDESPFEITVAPVSDDRPILASVSPRTAGLNDTITVTADRLDATGNVVYSNIGIIRSVPSSDGKSMSFRVSQLPNASGFTQNQSMNSFTVTFGVGTTAGQSLNYGYFNLTK